MSNSFGGFTDIIKLIAQKEHEEEVLSDIAERINELKEFNTQLQATISFVKEIKTNYSTQLKTTSAELKKLESELKSAVGQELFTQLLSVAESGTSNVKTTSHLNKLQRTILESDILKAIESAPSKAEQAEQAELESENNVVEDSSNVEVGTSDSQSVIVENNTQEVPIEQVVSSDSVLEKKEEVEDTDNKNEEVVEENFVHESSFQEPIDEIPVTQSMPDSDSDDSESELATDETNDSILAPPRPQRFRRIPRTL